jgi:hypothetical protein
MLFWNYSDVCSFSDTMFCNMVSFYNEELLAPHPTPRLEDLHLSIVRDCLFNIHVCVATVHIWRPPLLQPETRHSVLTGTHYHRQFLFTTWYLEIRNVIHKRCIPNMQISLHTHKWVPCSTSLEKTFWNIQVKDFHLCYSTPLSTAGHFKWNFIDSVTMYVRQCTYKK